jgi:nicotinate phosphoribosyltransferase
MTLPPFTGELYQYVLAAVYHQDGIWGEATFDLSLRSLPLGWSYGVMAGLEPVVEAIQNFRVPETLIEQLKTHPVFSSIKPSYFEHLKRLQFRGELWGVPEGEVVFPGEPLLRVSAPLVLCTLLETPLVGMISTSLFVASKASRIVTAARRPVMDFGSRRWPDPLAASLAARAAFIGGFAATTNAHAALQYNIPVIGTMPDTFLAAYGNDKLAIEAFRHRFPKLCHLTLPHQDPAEALKAYQGIRAQVQSIRIDHPDLHRLSSAVRAALDNNGMKHTKILGSGGLDEYRLLELVQRKSPVDWIAIGRALSSQDGSLSYKIAEIVRGAEPVPVTRQGASQYPGKKQIFRFKDRDIVGLELESPELTALGGKELLGLLLQEGERVGQAESLQAARARRVEALKKLPASLQTILPKGTVPKDSYSVGISDRLAGLALA